MGLRALRRGKAPRLRWRFLTLRRWMLLRLSMLMIFPRARLLVLWGLRVRRVKLVLLVHKDLLALRVLLGRRALKACLEPMAMMVRKEQQAHGVRLA